MHTEFLIAIYGVMMIVNIAYCVVSYVHGAMLRGLFTSLVAILAAWGFLHYLPAVLA